MCVCIYVCVCVCVCVYVSRDIRLGAKVSWSKSVEIIQGLFSYHYGIMLEINIKRYLKIAHIFSGAV